ncbi:MAG: hypothetical protein HQM13_10720 [SAR324 cluster bacterium]|nr:hypothetical protein [SAR324 cluster bacterium]
MTKPFNELLTLSFCFCTFESTFADMLHPFRKLNRQTGFLAMPLMLVIGSLVALPAVSSGEVLYSGLIGGIDRGDSASLPTLGLKIAFGAQDGWEMTYARGAIKSDGSFFEKERLLALQYRAISSGAVDTFLGGGIGLANSSSEAQGNTESVTNIAVVVTTGANFGISGDFAFKIGLDSFIILIPSANPLYAIGVRNFWYLGMEISL